MENEAQRQLTSLMVTELPCPDLEVQHSSSTADKPDVTSTALRGLTAPQQLLLIGSLVLNVKDP